MVQIFKSKDFLAQILQQDFEQILQIVLEYFDCLAVWEQGGKTPIFHETWAKSIIKILSSFTCDQRVPVVQKLQEKHCLRSQKFQNICAGVLGQQHHQKTLNKDSIRLQICGFAIAGGKHSDDDSLSTQSDRVRKKRKIAED